MNVGTIEPYPGRPTWLVLFHPASRRLGVVLLVAAFLLPLEGLGFDLCWFHNSVDLPCPGCGMTRSLIHLAHGEWSEAVRYHVFGPLVWGLVWVSALLELGGEGLRARTRAWLDAREPAARLVYRSIIGAFITFGVIRLFSAGFDLGWLPVPP